MPTRRDFIKSAALTGAVLGMGPAALLGQSNRSAAANTARRPARNIIFMVADGMNIGSLAAARQFQQLLLGQENAWLSLYGSQPIVRCLMETSSANSIVTDSAAASSSWGCGLRVNNGQINMSPVDGRPLEPLCTTVKNGRGMATGLVTTATVTHATPAGFAANTPKRGDEELIARQYLERKVDLLLGGGAKFYSEELLGQYREAGYGIVTERGELLALPAGTTPLLGLFTEGYLPFTIERDASPELQRQVPTLAEMTAVALERLSAAPDGFLLQVEGARVDHAGHANDAAALIHDQIAFDHAVALVRDFAAEHPDTLVIITTDHGTGGMNVNGMGPSYSGTTAAFEKLGKFTRSYGQMKKEAAALDADALRAYLESVTGIRFGGDKLHALALALQAVKAYSPDTMKAQEFSAKGLDTLPGIFQTETAVGWTSGNHTGELVEFTAFGPGAERFPPLVRNDQVHGLLLQAAGLA
ncbi:MAG: alkaline phosphatase [Verrucomicrobiota bacterium JB024]|nr:alkaline phosphatase [Verrucomicrobiota bacterium JB024]